MRLRTRPSTFEAQIQTGRPLGGDEEEVEVEEVRFIMRDET